MKPHDRDCEYWVDQYSWECTCGATERMTYTEWVERRKAELMRKKDDERS